uniref:PX domain-containing protein n=1 Tax=Capra hircus TaxID=9925 RepID=A0A8C2Y410_CAPHI
MASAVFEGTSLVNMFVRGCWVNGIRRLVVSRRGDEEEFFEIRTEWSDRSVLYLHRSLADLGRLWQRLRDAFPEDRPELARAPLRQGLIAIKEAHDIETRLNEVEKLLKAIISMPRKYSRSEVVLTFFERSPLDQVLKSDNVHKIQPSFQSPVKISEIMRSNGFCLANTETIVIDHSIPNGKDQLGAVDPTEHLRTFWTEAPRALPPAHPGLAPSSLDGPQVPARRPGPGLDTRPASPRRLPWTSAQDISSETVLGPRVLDDTGGVLSPRFPRTRMCGFQSCLLPSSQKLWASCQPRGVGGTLVVSGVSAAGTGDPLTGAHMGAIPLPVTKLAVMQPPCQPEKTGAGRSPSVPGGCPAALGEGLGSACSSPHRVY